MDLSKGFKPAHIKDNAWAPRPWAKGYYLMYFSTVLEPASHNKDLLFHLSDLGFNLLKLITNVQNNRKVQ